jgi:hypothetical protein
MSAGVQRMIWNSGKGASGAYFYQVIAGAERATGRILILK